MKSLAYLITSSDVSRFLSSAGACRGSPGTVRQRLGSHVGQGAAEGSARVLTHSLSARERHSMRRAPPGARDRGGTCGLEPMAKALKGEAPVAAPPGRRLRPAPAPPGRSEIPAAGAAAGVPVGGTAVVMLRGEDGRSGREVAGF
jgi:hypothetical protein